MIVLLLYCVVCVEMFLVKNNECSSLFVLLVGLLVQQEVLLLQYYDSIRITTGTTTKLVWYRYHKYVCMYVCMYV